MRLSSIVRALADVLPHVKVAVNNDYAADGAAIDAKAEVALDSAGERRLTGMISLTHEPIDCGRVLASVACNDAGAVVLFLGTTREFTHGRRTASLDYSVIRKWRRKSCMSWSTKQTPLADRGLPHRPSPGASAVGGGQHRHRGELAPPRRRLCRRQMVDRHHQAGGAYLEEGKWSDGTSEWVHPGLSNAGCDGT